MLLCSFLCEQKTGTLLGTLGRVGGRKGAGAHGAAQAAERVSGTGMDKGSPSLCQAWGAEGTLGLQNPDLRGC